MRFAGYGRRFVLRMTGDSSISWTLFSTSLTAYCDTNVSSGQALCAQEELVPLDGFMIRFNKNTFGLAAGGQLQVPQLLPWTSASTLVPMVLFQNISPGPPDTLLQVAFKNNEQPVWYFNDKIYFLVLFTEDGRMEHSTFLETWKSLPDSNEINRVLQDVQLDDQKRFKQFDSQRRARMEVYLESWNNGGVLRIYHLRKFGAS